MNTPNPTAAAPTRSARARLGALAGALVLATAALAAGGIDAAGAQEKPDAEAVGPADGTASDRAAPDAAASDGADPAAAGNDYPTTAIADYVLGCMAANGNSYEALQQCSCSIDFIKARMDYESYEEAETILKVQRDVGQRGIFYRDSNWAKRRVEQLEALQAESTLRCF